jgi:hypothetical protein
MSREPARISRTDPVGVKCPACGEHFSLDEAVLGGVREELARELGAGFQQREREIAVQQEALRKQDAALKRERVELEDTVESKVAERTRLHLQEIRAQEAKKAADEQKIVLTALEEELEAKSSALKKAHEEELKLRREKRELADAQQQLELDIERKVEVELEKMRTSFQAKADEENRLKLAEKEKLISDLQEKLKDAQRRAEQGSQQAQGEILELDFEQQLRRAFPLDRVNEIAKGVRGADVAHEVVGRMGRSCGVILYENKRTRNWSDAWCAKLKADMRDAHAEIGVIVTEVLPKGIARFAERDGVWITDVASALPLAYVLRASLVELAAARSHREGAKEKMELLYSYLTGPDFRQRVQAVTEAFVTMRGDLERERRALTKYWSKREKHINAVIENMAGMVGDVQALSGNALQALPVFELEDEEDSLGDADD